jgi:hypothetical protein
MRYILSKRTIFGCSNLIFAMLCFWSFSARASTTIAIDLPEMVQRADLIADVTVASVMSYWASPAGAQVIRTRISFTLNRPPVKGQVPSPFSLDFLGGTISGRAVRIEGMPTFKVGQRLIIFSHLPGTNFASPIIGMDQGSLQVIKDVQNNVDRVYRFWGEPVNESVPFAARKALSAGATPAHLRSADAVDTFLARVGRMMSP